MQRSLDVTSDPAADKQTCTTSLELVVSNKEGLYIWGNKKVVFFLVFDIVYTPSKSIGTKVISSTVRLERHVLEDLHGIGRSKRKNNFIRCVQCLASLTCSICPDRDLYTVDTSCTTTGTWTQCSQLCLCSICATSSLCVLITLYIDMNLHLVPFWQGMKNDSGKDRPVLKLEAWLLFIKKPWVKTKRNNRNNQDDKDNDGWALLDRFLDLQD